MDAAPRKVLQPAPTAGLFRCPSSLSVNDERIGVQVKRTKNSIKVEQIRSFVGALILGGFVKGIFVTTSSYQSGVAALVEQVAQKYIPIELIDENVFFEALSVAQIIGTDSTPKILNILQSHARPELYYVSEYHLASL
jgi:restriction system protein